MASFRLAGEVTLQHSMERNEALPCNLGAQHIGNVLYGFVQRTMRHERTDRCTAHWQGMVWLQSSLLERLPSSAKVGDVAGVGRANDDGQCNIPAAHYGVTPSQMYADIFHAEPLHSNDRAGACGANEYGQCNIPAVHDRVTYSQVCTYISHAVPLHSDGRAGVCGVNEYSRIVKATFQPRMTEWRSRRCMLMFLTRGSFIAMIMLALAEPLIMVNAMFQPRMPE
jgi:hypothetical protein